METLSGNFISPEKVGSLLLFLAFETLAISALIGALKGSFKFPRSKWEPLKKYHGLEAKIWGVLFFVCFSLLPLGIAYLLLQTPSILNFILLILAILMSAVLGKLLYKHFSL